MTIAATSAKGSAMQRLAALVAASAAFQLEAGISDPEQLLAGGQQRIFYPFLRPEYQEQPPLPFAIITVPAGGLAHYRVAGGGQTYTLPRGQLMLGLGQLITLQGPEDAEIAFTNFEEAVLTEILDRSGVSDELNMVEAQLTMPPARVDPRQVAGQHARKPYYHCQYTISWDAQ